MPVFLTASSVCRCRRKKISASLHHAHDNHTPSAKRRRGAPRTVIILTKMLPWRQLGRHIVIPRAFLRKCRVAVSGRESVRSFSIDTSTSSAFDRDLKRQQRDNAARAHVVWKNSSKRGSGNRKEEDGDAVDYNYFRQEMANRLVERLDDIRRDEG